MQFGLPHTIVSDNGTQFTATEFQEFCQRGGIRHTTVAPYHPSSNGLAERAVRVVKDGLKKLSGDTLENKLSALLFQPTHHNWGHTFTIAAGTKPTFATGHPQASSRGKSSGEAAAAKNRQGQEIQGSAVYCG